MTRLVALTRSNTAVVATLVFGLPFNATAQAAHIGEDASSDADAARRAGEAMFEALDKNADQQLSKIEAAVDIKLSDTFAAADANSDGYLSRAEYLARPRS